MVRQAISSNTPWESTIGYSRAVRMGNHVWVAGTTATDENGVVIGKGNVVQQTRYVLQKIKRALHETGASMNDVVRERLGALRAFKITSQRLWACERRVA